MSEENLRVVREIYDAWGTGDFTAGGDHLDPHVTWVVRPPFPESTVLTGTVALNDYMLVFLAQFEPGSLAIEAERLQAVGDTVIAAVYQHGNGRTSGIEVGIRFFMLFSFRGGKIIRMESVMDEAEAAAGI